MVVLAETEENIYWHSAFYEAIQLELSEYADSLDFINEYQLSKEALIMDVLVVKKEQDVHIEKNIGSIFKGHNIIEYKSEKDYISVDDYYKVFGYANLYKAFEHANIDDITITFVETKHPRNLLNHLKTVRGFEIIEPYNGIYYIKGDLFPVQIIESKRLSKEENIWIKSLSSNLKAADIAKLLEVYQSIGRIEKNNAYISVIMDANAEMMKEVLAMSSAVLKEILTEAFEKNGWMKEAFEKNGWMKEAEAKIEERKAIEVAKELLNMGMTIEQVAKATKLSLEKIILLKQ